MELKNINWKHTPIRYAETSVEDRSTIEWEFKITETTTVLVTREKVNGKFTSGAIYKPYSCQTVRDGIIDATTLKLGLNITAVDSYIDDVIQGVEFKIKDGILVKYRGEEPNVVIPNGVTSIYSRAFFYIASTISSIVIPDSITSIDCSAFHCTPKLKDVYYNGTIEDWCKIEFRGTDANPMHCAENFYMLDDNGKYYLATDLKLVIPDNITAMSFNAFIGFSCLTSVVIPKSVTKIGNYAFYIGSSLIKDVYYDGTIEDWCKITFDGYFANPMQFTTHFYMRNNCGEYAPLTELIIPENIDVIKSNAFIRCSTLETVVILNSALTKLKYSCFRECPNLKCVVSLGPVDIGPDAFYCCESLSNAVFNGDIVDIHIGAFARCPSLLNVMVKGNINKVGPRAFIGCKALTAISADSIKGVSDDAFREVCNLNDDTLAMIETVEEKEFKPFMGFDMFCCCCCRSNNNNK